MSRSCLVCANPNRERIDRALAQGESLALIAKRYGLSKASIFRHGTNHRNNRDDDDKSETRVTRAPNSAQQAEQRISDGTSRGSTPVRLESSRSAVRRHRNHAAASPGKENETGSAEVKAVENIGAPRKVRPSRARLRAPQKLIEDGIVAGEPGQKPADTHANLALDSGVIRRSKQLGAPAAILSQLRGAGRIDRTVNNISATISSAEQEVAQKTPVLESERKMCLRSAKNRVAARSAAAAVGGFAVNHLSSAGFATR